MRKSPAGISTMPSKGSAAGSAAGSSLLAVRHPPAPRTMAPSTCKHRTPGLWFGRCTSMRTPPGMPLQKYRRVEGDGQGSGGGEEDGGRGDLEGLRVDACIDAARVVARL